MTKKIDLRVMAVGAVLAVFLSSRAVLSLIYGFAGAPGNYFVTGFVLAGSTLAVFFLSVRRIGFNSIDFVFAVFVCCIATSYFVMDWSATQHEVLTLALSLSAYPAFRFLTIEDTAGALKPILIATSIIVVIGAPLTAFALIDVWDSIDRIKPIVLGFESAPVYFAHAVSVALLMIVCRNLNFRGTVIVLSVSVVPVLIFAAAGVRFVFVGLLLAMISVLFVSKKSQQRNILLISLVVFVSVGAGWMARAQIGKIMLSYVLEVGSVQKLPDSILNERKDGNLPSCHADVNIRNSLDVRAALLKDAIYLVPKAGLTGFGLDGFTSQSCINRTQVHNSILQATVEFGWIGGVLLVALISLTLITLASRAPGDDNIKIVFGVLIYVVSLSMVYGRLSQDAMLFALLGWSVGLLDKGRSSDPSHS